MFGRRAKSPRQNTNRILFATDIHGSEVCFRKFLNGGKAYDCEYLILGGDITGKLLIPVVEVSPGRYTATYGEHRYDVAAGSELHDLLTRIRRFGHYPYLGKPDDVAELDDEAALTAAFRKAVYDGVADWVSLAEDRLRGTGRRIFMAPGNDDFLEIDAALEGSDVVEFAEGRVIELECGPMITTGYSNPTPWETERELSEPELLGRLEAMMEDIADPHRAIAVIHPPPYDSSLDDAPALDSEFRVNLQMGSGIEMAPVGSTAVREFVERYQPRVSLHGHVHESGGAAHIGRTLCLNPGSYYHQGRLCSAIVELARDDRVTFQFVEG